MRFESKLMLMLKIHILKYQHFTFIQLFLLFHAGTVNRYDQIICFNWILNIFIQENYKNLII